MAFGGAEMGMAPTLLILVLALPAAAAAAVFALGARNLAAARGLALAAVLANLALTVALVVPAAGELAPRGSEPAATTYRPLYETNVLAVPFGDGPGGVRFHVGLDGMNVWLVLLTSFLMVPSVLVGWNAIRERGNEYYAWLLALQAAMTGVFLSFDIILFYVFFELTLVPLYFLIGIWGGPMRREASRKFFLYTLAGSLITLLGMMA